MALSWGRWQDMCYYDDTVIVRLEDRFDKPWLSVQADIASTKERRFRSRCEMAIAIAAYLNGEGQRPVWLDDFDRVNADRAIALAGAALRARSRPSVAHGQQETHDRELLLDALGIPDRRHIEW